MNLVHFKVNSIINFIIAVGVAEYVFQVRLITLHHNVIGCFPQADISGLCEISTVSGVPFYQIDGVSIFEVIAAVEFVGFGLGHCLGGLLPFMFFLLTLGHPKGQIHPKLGLVMPLLDLLCCHLTPCLDLPIVALDCLRCLSGCPEIKGSLDQAINSFRFEALAQKMESNVG